MSDEMKKVVLTGSAASDMTGGVKRGKRSRSKKAQQGGAEITKEQTLPQEQVQPSPKVVQPLPKVVQPLPKVVQGGASGVSYVSTASSPDPKNWLSYPAASPIPPIVKPEINPSQTGGTIKNVKVELKRKVATKKVHLQPKRSNDPKPILPYKSSKKSRKVTIGLSKLHKRVMRAKKFTRKAKELPLEQLKEQLIQKKLIKPTSKAPESVLRQIAADAQIVASKSL